MLRCVIPVLGALVLAACGGSNAYTLDDVLVCVAEGQSCMDSTPEGAGSTCWYSCETKECTCSEGVPSTCRNELPPGISCTGGFVYSKSLRHCAKPDCDPGESWNGSMGRCVCVPAPWEIWNGTDCVPRCNSSRGLYWNGVSQRCTCVKGSRWLDSQRRCITDKEGEERFSDAVLLMMALNGACPTAEYRKDSDGNCELACRGGEWKNSTCMCPSGTFHDGSDACLPIGEVLEGAYDDVDSAAGELNDAVESLEKAGAELDLK